MIIRQNQLNQKEINNLILFYGKNEGLKKDKINDLINKKKNSLTLNLGEEEILKNKNILFDEILNKSFFDNQKNILINDASDKIFNLVVELLNIEIKDTLIILNSGSLEKKSKLRNLFEKEEKLTCVAFYEDNFKDLLKLTNSFLSEKKISLSQSNINFLINKSNADRRNLLNELEKIELFSNQKTITIDSLLKLVNLSENYSISELADSFLNKNLKKITNIFNENNFYNEDSFIIVKTLQNKSKKLLLLSKEFKKNKNIELTITKAKPPIFWKDKDLVKEQLTKRSYNNIKQLIFDLYDLEKLVKKNINLSINIISNFMINECVLKNQ